MHVAGIAFREDASNDDLWIPRSNRIRHETPAAARCAILARLVDVLHRKPRIAREDAEYLEEAARGAAARLVSRTARGFEIDAEALLSEPLALTRRVIRHAQQMAAGADHFIGFDAGEAVRRFVVSKSQVNSIFRDIA